MYLAFQSSPANKFRFEPSSMLSPSDPQTRRPRRSSYESPVPTAWMIGGGRRTWVTYLQREDRKLFNTQRSPGFLSSMGGVHFLFRASEDAYKSSTPNRNKIDLRLNYLESMCNRAIFASISYKTLLACEGLANRHITSLRFDLL